MLRERKNCELVWEIFSWWYVLSWPFNKKKSYARLQWKFHAIEIIYNAEKPPTWWWYDLILVILADLEKYVLHCKAWLCLIKKLKKLCNLFLCAFTSTWLNTGIILVEVIRTCINIIVSVHINSTTFNMVVFNEIIAS